MGRGTLAFAVVIALLTLCSAQFQAVQPGIPSQQVICPNNAQSVTQNGQTYCLCSAGFVASTGPTSTSRASLSIVEYRSLYGSEGVFPLPGVVGSGVEEGTENANNEFADLRQNHSRDLLAMNDASEPVFVSESLSRRDLQAFSRVAAPRGATLLSSNRLTVNQQLLPNQGVPSCALNYALYLLTDGNICIFRLNAGRANSGLRWSQLPTTSGSFPTTATWCTNVRNPNPRNLVMQGG